ncbi:MAG: CDP-alcohol phosphatidyltransferase family protein [Candidatus Komeilibacteria bacterium]
MILEKIKCYIKLRDRKDRVFKPLVDILPDWLTPNIITAIRFVFVWPTFYLWWLASNPYTVWQTKHWIATGIFIFIWLFTDYLDGAVARYKNKITLFGTFFDPLTDKLFALPTILLAAWYWPSWSALYFLFNLKIFMILLVFIKIVVLKFERFSDLVQIFYIAVASGGTVVFIVLSFKDFVI